MRRVFEEGRDERDRVEKNGGRCGGGGHGVVVVGRENTCSVFFVELVFLLDALGVLEGSRRWQKHDTK